MNACEQACVSLAGALGPFGEYVILIAAGLVAYFSRRQVMRTRSELGNVKAEADAYKTAVLSIRPVSDLAQFTIPPLPAPSVQVRSGFSPSSPRPSEARPSIPPPDDDNDDRGPQ